MDEKFNWSHLRSVFPELSVLRRAVFSGRLLITDTHNTPRSLIWKLFLVLKTYDQKTWVQLLSKYRAKYTALVDRYGPSIDPAAVDKTSPDHVEKNGRLKFVPEQAILDPLSDSWYGAEQEMNDDQLLDIINKDVERTFPDIDYFRKDSVQKSLTNILFVYAKLNPDVSYKQGMHELAAPMLWVVAQDGMLGKDDPILSTMFDPSGAEADAFELFSEIMKSAKPWYLNGPDSQLPPIVAKSVHIQQDILQKADPELYQTLKDNMIEPQIWGIRWIRLLFGREFGFDHMLALWDSLFANPVNVDEEGDHLELVDYICVVMLLRVRNRIIGAEHTDILTTLLNYPLDGQTVDTMFFYVTNGTYLQRNLSPGGAKYVYEQYTSSGGMRISNSSSGGRTSSGSSSNSNHESDSPATSTPVRPSSRIGFDTIMDKAKVYSKTMIDQTQKWDMDRIVRQKFNDVKAKARNGFDQATKPLSGEAGVSLRDEALSEILGNALEILDKELVDDKKVGAGSVKVKAAIESVRHVQQCLRDASIPPHYMKTGPVATSTGNSAALSPATLKLSSPLPSTSTDDKSTLGSPVSSQYSKRINSQITMSPSPPPNLPRPSLSTSSRRNTASNGNNNTDQQSIGASSTTYNDTTRTPPSNNSTRVNSSTNISSTSSTSDVNNISTPTPNSNRGTNTITNSDIITTPFNSNSNSNSTPHTNTSNQSTPTKPLFKSPARTSLAQSEFAWMISDVTTPSPSSSFTTSTSSSSSGFLGSSGITSASSTSSSSAAAAAAAAAKKKKKKMSSFSSISVVPSLTSSSSSSSSLPSSVKPTDSFELL